MKQIRCLVFLVFCCILLLGCASNEKNVGKHEFMPLKFAGYYSDLRFAPNGEFFVRGKLNEEEAKKHGVVFKVEVDENKRIKQITAMDGGNPINTEWYDTLYFYSGIVREAFTNRDFSIITMEYQDDSMELFSKRRIFLRHGIILIQYDTNTTTKSTMPLEHIYITLPANCGEDMQAFLPCNLDTMNRGILKKSVILIQKGNVLQQYWENMKQDSNTTKTSTRHFPWKWRTTAKMVA